MIPGEVERAVMLYIRLIAYPAGIIGVLWLMLFRSDWRRRMTSLFYLGAALLQTAQFATVLIRIVSGENASLVASDVLITPALVLFNLGLWLSIIWLSRRWRHDPDGWL